jgi:hypothetical protein
MTGEIFTSNNIIMGFSPNDFFYYQVQAENLMPSDNAKFDISCNTLDIHNPTWDTRCNSILFKDNSYNCIYKEICKNKEKVNKLSDIQTVHSGSDGKYLDTTIKYTNNITDTINLIVGVIGLSIYIMQNRNL